MPEKSGSEKIVNIFTVEGIIMLTIGLFFDVAAIICTVLILAAGTGEIAAIIVDIVAIIFISMWSFIRGKIKKMTQPEEEEEEEGGEGVYEEKKELSLPDRTKQRIDNQTEIFIKEAEAELEIARAEKITAAKGAKTLQAEARLAKASKMAKFAKIARWGKIITPIKNAVPGLGLIPTWTPTIFFELMS